jgi:DNA-binding cell septation regulator SpoVG
LRSDRDVGATIDVSVDHLRVVHSVQVIAGENQVVVRVVPDEMSRRLPHRVRRSLKPALAVGRLFSRQDFDEPVAE